MTRIVIIGGGPAGINTAQSLAKNLTEADKTEVVVLEKNAYFYHVVGAPRAYVDANFTNKMFAPYDNAFPKNTTKFVRIVRGVATQISSNTNEVLYRAIDKYDMESSATTALHFDYLVLTMGSTYTVPIKQDSHDYARSATESKLQQVRSYIETANKILVVGGGSVGCEVAAEIKAKYPEKSVTILDANTRLISGSNLRDKFYAKLNASLAELGVKRGAVKVNEQLQLEGARYSNMFALGDVCNHPSPKMSFIAGQQGTFLAGELIAVIRKKQPSFTKPFPGAATEVMILPIGPNGGVTQLPMFGGVVMGNWVTKTIKSKDYFAGQVWSSIGATVPK
ncbi:hypothetical protein PI124_g5936 [Phytophthora idaei]|nr:hypothetical protein PI124_g5936 [Phytophthora idaei]